MVGLFDWYLGESDLLLAIWRITPLESNEDGRANQESEDGGGS